MKNFILLGLFLISFGANAENQFSSWHKYTSGKFLAEEDGVAPGQKLTIGFDILLGKNWHAYWVNPGDSGAPIKLSLNAKVGNKNLDLLTGPIQFPLPERMETGPITSFVYKGEVLFLADLVIPESLLAGERLDLHLDAEWLVCAEVCIPAIASFDLVLPVKNKEDIKPSEDAEAFLQWRGRLPRMTTSTVAEKRDDKKVELTFSKPSDFSRFRFTDFFPLRGSQLSNEKPTLLLQSSRQVKLSQAARAVGNYRSDLIGLVLLSDGKTNIGLQWGDPSYGFQNKEPSRANSAPGGPAVSLVWILFSAFLGGLILNLMPCVFPILSIKLLSLVKQSGAEMGKVRAQNFSYTIGVLLSFLSIGITLSALRGAGSLVGWGFQLQSPYFILLTTWLFFVLALQLLGFYEFTWIDGNMGGRLARQGGNAGAFFTGVLAVIVASPCTAPFMGAALGFAISQPTPVLLAVFLLMGLGLAFPYLLFGLFPSWSRVLPRPGPWMQTFKNVMAIPLFLTCAWLIWLLMQLKGSAGLTVALIGMAFWFFIFWRKSNRYVASIAMSCLVLTVGLGAMYRLPDAVASADTSWEPFQESTAFWAPGAPPMLIDFTADWCLTCKVNERLVLDRAEIMAMLKVNHVRLVKGDWTRQDATITQFLARYQRIGVPFYIAYGPGAPEGKILPEVLTPELFKNEMQLVLQNKEGTK